MNFRYQFQSNLRKLKSEFTVRAFLTLLIGFLLLAGNALLFVLSAIELFSESEEIAPAVIVFLIGSVGFFASCFLIVVVSFFFATSPQSADGAQGSSFLSEALSYRGKERAKRLAIYVFLLVFMFGGACASLGYYISEKVKFSKYPEAEATVVSSDTWREDSRYEYEYTVNGISYQAWGHVQYSSASSPRYGDKVTVKYNPSDPSELMYIQTESKFFLGFGGFLLFFGIITVAYEFFARGKIPFPFFLAFIMLGLFTCVVLCTLSSSVPQGFVDYFARNFWIHFVMMFANVGLLEFFHGIIYLGQNRRMKKTR